MVLPGSCQSEWLVLPSRDMVSTEPRLLLKTMSGPVVLLHPSSVLMSVASLLLKAVTAGIWVASILESRDQAAAGPMLI